MYSTSQPSCCTFETAPSSSCKKLSVEQGKLLSEEEEEEEEGKRGYDTGREGVIF